MKKLDGLILSGKSCNLDLVKRELYLVFSQSDYFVWNEEKVTFEPKYTKLATSAGAMLAERYRQLTFDPRAAIRWLRQGANQLYIDVKNLSFCLPCSFFREGIGGTLIEIFGTGDSLYQLQIGAGIVKRRSGWQGIQLTNSIKRIDFKNKKPQPWGGYNGNALMKELEIAIEEKFRNLIKIEFEIDQNLDIEVLLCRGNPHHLITTDAPSLDAARAIGVPELISQEGQVVYDIAINVLESAYAMKTDGETIIFSTQQDDRQKLSEFRDSQTLQPLGKGLIAKLSSFPQSRKHTFFFRKSPEERWEPIGELSQPEVITDYPHQYYVSLSAKGILRVHAFEVPYWTSDKRKECLMQEGCVFRDKLISDSGGEEDDQDPFSGNY